MYGQSKYISVDRLRHLKITNKCDGKVDATRNIDMATLPPCKKTLVEHIRRVNYQVAIWKNAHIAQPNIPDPCDNNGWTKKTGVLEPLWFKENEVVPESMVDMLIDSVSNEDVSDQEDVNIPSQDLDSFSDQYNSETSEDSETE